MSADHDDSLAQLAAALGVEDPRFEGSEESRAAKVETVRAVAESLLGHECNDPARELEELRRDRSLRLVAPAFAVWEHEPAFMSVNQPGSPTELDLEIELESGGTRGWTANTDGMAPAAEGTVSVALPPDIPAGYHRLRVRAGGEQAESLLICSPVRAYQDPEKARDWGVFLPLYALHSGRSAGTGDLTDLKELIRWTESLGGSAAGTLPLLAQFYDEAVFEPSPYVPASRLMWNEVYLDTDAIEPRQRGGAPAPGGPFAGSGPEPLVNWPEVTHRKRRALLAAMDALTEEQETSFGAFRRDTPLVVDYAGFRARTRSLGPWPGWPPGAAPPDPREERYHAFVQWVAGEQLVSLSASARGGLYLDLPLGVHPASFDTWRWPNCFLPGLNAGAPPDALAGGGQDWGFPPLNPEGILANSFEYVIAYLRHNMRHAARLRIDHVMGLHHLFVIPRGLPASRGIYLRYPADELYAIVCLESHRNRTEVVGENLGTVPGYVNEAMTRHALSGMYILPFELDRAAAAIRSPATGTTAALNTHDLPTFAAWWSGADIDLRLRLGHTYSEPADRERVARSAERETILAFLDREGLISANGARSPDTVRDALLRFLGESPARLVLANMEDLWGEIDPQNVPGTSTEQPNWRRRSRLSLEQMQASPAIAASLRGLAAARRGKR